jgi:hypothetical protein
MTDQRTIALWLAQFQAVGLQPPMGPPLRLPKKPLVATATTAEVVVGGGRQLDPASDDYSWPDNFSCR